VLLGSDDYEGLLETLEILSDREAVKRLIEAEEDFRLDEGVDLELLRGRLEAGSTDER
jgi:PHD/YefM family antitoxin component YafN of YafNO toxin-antitoxin module